MPIIANVYMMNPMTAPPMQRNHAQKLHVQGFQSAKGCIVSITMNTRPNTTTYIPAHNIQPIVTVALSSTFFVFMSFTLCRA